MIKQHIENLINHQIKNEVISKRDYIYVKNQLYSLLGVELIEEVIKLIDITYPSEALNPILEILVKENKLEDSIVAKDLFDSKIMNIFAKLPSVVQDKFETLLSKNSKDATNWLFNYVTNLNYVRYDRILKNVSFETKSLYGNLQITINLSKPEKDPKSIALQAQTKSVQYPKCVLCQENEGFSGNFNRDSRNQHRLIELDLNNESWFLQYSPYIYYPEHTIVLSKEHRNMRINETTFSNLLKLVEKFDGYFFGSNADIPIVGGSILSHDHYQGGKHVFPIENAKVLKTFKTKNNITVETLHWPLSTIRIKGDNISDLVSLATHTLNKWKNYSNKNLNIKAYTNDVTHHSITPVARKKNNLYELDLILRDNQTNDKYPLGIFHPHEDKWHIKKENIGLIEAVGLAILPARLKEELIEVKNYLLNKQVMTPLIEKHSTWIKNLIEKYSFNEDNIEEIVNQEVGNVFMNVLIDCGVFKEKDYSKFNKFVQEEII